MRKYTKSEARQITKRLYKAGSVEPRQHSPAHLSDEELIRRLSETKDKRKSSRLARELARRITAERYQSRHSQQ